MESPNNLVKRVTDGREICRWRRGICPVAQKTIGAPEGQDGGSGIVCTDLKDFRARGPEAAALVLFSSLAEERHHEQCE